MVARLDCSSPDASKRNITELNSDTFDQLKYVRGHINCKETNPFLVSGKRLNTRTISAVKVPLPGPSSIRLICPPRLLQGGSFLLPIIVNTFEG